ANQRAPIRGTLSARTESQLSASKKRVLDGRDRKVSARTSGKSASSRSTTMFARVTCSPLLVDIGSTIRGKLEESPECARVHESQSVL
ncbi:hypothetical protein TSAR_005100, partial [Trichomalopsis sarcophagae]